MTYISGQQIDLLLKPIHPKRVLIRAGMSYVEGYDIKAELNRIFGFGRWSAETLSQALICDDQIEMNNKKPGWYVVYRTSLRLTICAPDGTKVCCYEESHVGESTHPVRGEAHGNALTNSWTYALKRCASNLGDQFGLSLYGKGSMEPLVRWTLVRPETAETSEADTDDVPQVAPEGESRAETAAPAAAQSASPAANGNGHAPQGRTERPAPPQTAPVSATEIDKDAQAFADEAFEALTVPALAAVHARAREAHKLAALICNPATGGTGGLGQYMNYRKGLLEKADRSLAALEAAGQQAGLDRDEVDRRVGALNGGKGINGATAEDMDKAAALILKGAKAAA